jgi:hypothetical protein
MILQSSRTLKTAAATRRELLAYLNANTFP